MLQAWREVATKDLREWVAIGMLNIYSGIIQHCTATLPTHLISALGLCNYLPCLQVSNA